MLAQGPVILIVHPDVPAKNLQELIALAKKTELSFASGGIGASTHLVGVMVNLKAGTKITPRAVQGHGSRADRAARRPCHDAVRRHQLGGALRARRARCGPSRSPAIIAIPTCPTCRPSPESGLKGADVTQRLGPACAAGHADRDPAHHARRDRRGDARSGRSPRSSSSAATSRSSTRPRSIRRRPPRWSISGSRSARP